jgi:gas vesicle protein
MEKQLTSAILTQIHNLSSHLEPGLCPRNDTEVNELIYSNNLEETLDKWTEEIKNNARQINKEIASKSKFIRQVMYNTDAKKTMQLLTKDQTPQCEIDHGQLKEFFDDRWKTGEPMNRNLAESIYKMKETINDEMKKIMDDLIDFTKMKELLRTRGNLSAPELDGITNPLLK